MFRPFVELAISKASSDSEIAALNHVLEAATVLDEEERTFGNRMNANKALRGEGPTKLSKRKRSEVGSYAADANELEAQQLKDFASFERGAAIIASLAPSLRADIEFWESSYKMAHPSDVPIVQAFVAKKACLFEAMGRYLSEYRCDDS